MTSGPILITGANGFVGRATAAAAQALGLRTILTDRTGQARAAEPGRSGGGGPGVVVADLTDAGAVQEMIGAAAPVAVIHLAAYGEGGDGLAAGAAADPGRAVHVNVCGFMNVLRACANVGARLVWSSSTTVFGPAADYPGGPVGEGVARTPQSVYGATKVACEDLARLAGPALGVPVAGLRLPLVYGPGRWYGGSQETLVRFVADLAAGRDARIAAWDAPADWIHVDDAAHALLLAATRAAAADGIYHVVGHRGSLAELAGELAVAAGRGTVTGGAEGAPDLPLTDDGRIRTELGFQPRHPTARSGAVDYYSRA